MVSTVAVTYQDICQQIAELPQESLAELAKYIEFLRFKASGAQKGKQAKKPVHIRDLEGLLEGYDFSPEFIAEARREMWGNFPRDIEIGIATEES
jgi:hypothetical protein